MHNVGDPVLLKSRVLTRQCRTCVFRPGNPVMDAARRDEFEQASLRAGAFIPCHSTYPPLGVGPAAVCRGFYTRNRGSGILMAMEVMWGFVFVEPPAYAKDEPEPDTPRKPLPKPKEPEPKPERDIPDPREKRWF